MLTGKSRDIVLQSGRRRVCQRVLADRRRTAGFKCRSTMRQRPWRAFRRCKRRTALTGWQARGSVHDRRGGGMNDRADGTRIMRRRRRSRPVAVRFFRRKALRRLQCAEFFLRVAGGMRAGTIEMMMAKRNRRLKNHGEYGKWQASSQYQLAPATLRASVHASAPLMAMPPSRCIVSSNRGESETVEPGEGEHSATSTRLPHRHRRADRGLLRAFHSDAARPRRHGPWFRHMARPTA
jgi:hypothetical protein